MIKTKDTLTFILHFEVSLIAGETSYYLHTNVVYTHTKCELASEQQQTTCFYIRVPVKQTHCTILYMSVCTPQSRITRQYSPALQIMMRIVNVICDISLNLYRILCCDHSLESSRRDDSNEW